MPIDGREDAGLDRADADLGDAEDDGIIAIVEDEYLESDGGVDEPCEVEETLSPHDDRPVALSATLKSISEDHRAAEIMTNFATGEFTDLTELREKLEAIQEMSPSAAIKAIDALVKEFFVGKVSVYIQQSLLSEMPEGHPAFTLEKAAKIGPEVFRGLKSGSPEYVAWYEICSLMAWLKYFLLSAYTSNSSKARETMHSSSRIEYAHFAEIGETVNGLYLAWVKDNGSLLSTEERKSRSFVNEMAAIRMDDTGEFVEVPWSRAYPDEVAAVVEAYGKLVGTLRRELDVKEVYPPGAEFLSPEDREVYEKKARYYEALAKAYETSELEDFLEADTLLPGQINGRTDLPIHVHSIEFGYGADEIQRIPEASLRFPDEEGENINEMARKTRTDMLRELEEFLGEGQYSEAMRDTMALVAATTYLTTDFLSAGMELDFLPAAQILPNEADCRAKGGVSVTANRTTMRERMERVFNAFVAVFGEEIAAALFQKDKVDLDKVLGRRTASHEYGHAVGFTADCLDRLDRQLVSTFSEEWKATVGGMVLAELRTYLRGLSGGAEATANTVTYDDLKESLVAHIALAARYASMRKQSHAVPYLRKSLMLMKVMQEVGIVVAKGDDWTIDLDDKKVEQAYAILERQYIELLGIYDRGNTANLRAFMEKYLQPCDFTRFVFERVNQQFAGDLQEASTIEEVCQLPAVA